MTDELKIESLNRDSVRIWDEIAPWWDDFLGDEGNWTYRKLVAPNIERLLALREDELVLDIACGSGLFSRRMAQLKAQVVAFDASKVFIERAKGSTVENSDRIEYMVMDATNGDQLLTLGERRFNAAVCNNALQDIPNLEPLADSLRRVLKANGRFVFSVPHPCFNSVGAQKTVEQVDRDGQLDTVYSVKMSRYIRGEIGTGIGIDGQPRPHYYFDRPLSVTLNTFFKAGFVLDGIVEPVADRDEVSSNPFSWANYTEIPSQLTARLRLSGV